MVRPRPASLALSALCAVHGSAASARFQRKPEPVEEALWKVSGRVLEAGTNRPLGGMRARVLLRKVPYAWMIPAGDPLTTDAEGRFRVSVHFPATYVLYATEIELPNTSALGRGTTRPRFGQVFRPVAIGGPPGGTTECAVALGPAATVRVTLTGEEGGGVPGASVVAVSEDAPHPIQLVDCPKTDERGGVEFLGLGEGSWRILVCKRGVGVASAELPDLRWGERRELGLKLGPSGDLYVACRLRPPGGETDLAEISAVMWEVYEGNGKLVSAGPASPLLWGFGNMDDLPASKDDPAFVYAGSYAPGVYRVVVRSPKPDPSTVAEFARDAPEAAEEVAIEAGRESRVRLTLPLPAPR